MVSAASSTRLQVEHPLCGLLCCAGCGVPLTPLTSAEGARCYQSPCGCRLRPIDAAMVERLTYDALDGRGLVPPDGVLQGGWATLMRREMAVVRVGAVPDELIFCWRT